jgi:hypothetical protein
MRWNTRTAELPGRPWQLIAIALAAMLLLAAIAVTVGPVAASGHVAGEITAPTQDAIIFAGPEGTANVALGATYESNAGNMQWAVRNDNEGCVRGTNNANNRFGNVDGMSDSFSWNGTAFSASVVLEPGAYCFVTNPINGERLVVAFVVATFAKEACKGGGWEDFGFRNQGLCIQFFNTGKDSR